MGRVSVYSSLQEVKPSFLSFDLVYVVFVLYTMKLSLEGFWSCPERLSLLVKNSFFPCSLKVLKVSCLCLKLALGM